MISKFQSIVAIYLGQSTRATNTAPPMLFIQDDVAFNIVEELFTLQSLEGMIGESIFEIVSRLDFKTCVLKLNHLICTYIGEVSVMVGGLKGFIGITDGTIVCFLAVK